MNRLSSWALLLRSDAWIDLIEPFRTSNVIVQTFKCIPRLLSTDSSKCENVGYFLLSRNHSIIFGPTNHETILGRNNKICNHTRSFSSYRKKNSQTNRFFLLNTIVQTREMSSKFSDKETALLNKYKPRDVKFKNPYGHIAGLEWGSQDAPNKILCAHGWLDNAGSFERLIPFILDHNNNQERYHIIAMDMPGVGLSSHRPPGANYTTLSNIVEMRRVSQQLGWNKLTLLAHSQGSHFAFIYACIYPEQVEALVTIDLAHPLARQVHNWNVSIANSIEEHFRCEYHHEDDPTSNIRVPVYSEVDAIKRLMDGHSNSLTQESAETLLKRGAKKQRWGYTFNRDVRLRYLSLEMWPNEELMLQFMSGPFKPNLLIIRASRSPYHRSEELRLKFYDLFERNCPIFHDTMLEGTHHLHMNNPETVAPEIIKFLDQVERSHGRSTVGKSQL